MKIEGTDIKIHAEALGCALKDSGKTKAGSTVLALGEYVKDLEARLEKREKDAEFLNWCADRFVHVHGESENVDFVLKLRAIAAMQSAKESQ